MADQLSNLSQDANPTKEIYSSCVKIMENLEMELTLILTPDTIRPAIGQSPWDPIAIIDPSKKSGKDKAKDESNLPLQLLFSMSITLSVSFLRGCSGDSLYLTADASCSSLLRVLDNAVAYGTQFVSTYESMNLFN